MSEQDSKNSEPPKTEESSRRYTPLTKHDQAFLACAEAGEFEAMKLIMPRADMGRCLSGAINSAADHGNVEVTRLLLHLAKPSVIHTAAMHAAGSPDVLKILIEASDKKEEVVLGALTQAAKKATSRPGFDYLLAMAPATADLSCALLAAAADHQSDPEVIGILAQRSTKDAIGEALRFAARFLNRAAFDKLAPLCSEEKLTETLQYAAWLSYGLNRHTPAHELSARAEMVRELIAKNAKPANADLTLLRHLVSLGDTELLKDVLKNSSFPEENLQLAIDQAVFIKNQAAFELIAPLTDITLTFSEQRVRESSKSEAVFIAAGLKAAAVAVPEYITDRATRVNKKPAKESTGAAAKQTQGQDAAQPSSPRRKGP